ncbi:MAG: hypothetical protein H0W83_06715 [Planctomycetes bacterium]|nr:hypothetical protein [Planctomycetota bacterium]
MALAETARVIARKHRIRSGSAALIALGCAMGIVGCAGRPESASGNIRACSPSMTDVGGHGMLVSESPGYHWADSR